MLARKQPSQLLKTWHANLTLSRSAAGDRDHVRLPAVVRLFVKDYPLKGRSRAKCLYSYYSTAVYMYRYAPPQLSQLHGLPDCR